MINKSPYKVLIALNAFKGSMDSREACNALESGLQKAFACSHIPLECIQLPLSDGGDGLLLALKDTCSFYRECRAEVSAPDGKKIQASYLLHENKAILEMAQSSGLVLIPKSKRRAMNASSYGLGEMILHAYKQGAREIVLGVGGSASNDCGAGCLQALGIDFFDKNGALLPHGIAGKDLNKIAKIGGEILIKDVTFSLLCDVDNPLLGANGATYVYGPQKGMIEGDLEFLESNMAYFASLVEQYFQVETTSLSAKPSSGAAGGIVFALRSFCNVTVERGANRILTLINAEEKIQNVDLVITGEGKLDFQSSFGKAPVAIALLSHKFNKPVIGVSGALGDGYEELHDLHLRAMFSLVNEPMSLTKAMKNAKSLLASLGREIGGILTLHL